MDLIVWGLDENPIGALFVHALWYKDSKLWIAVTFDGSLVLGSKLEDPLYHYNEEHGLPQKISQMKAATIIDIAEIKEIESIDDKINMPFLLDLMSFFNLMEHLYNAARTAKIPSGDLHLVYELSQLGRNIL